MPVIRNRLHRHESPGGFRYLTFSCYKRLPLLGTARMRDLMARSIESARVWCQFEVYAYVVMPEHLHLMIRPDVREFTVDAISQRIKQPVATRAIGRWRKLGAPVLPRLRSSGGEYQFWQAGGGFDRNPRDEDELFREICYIHHNPVKRRLVANAPDWAWSSARWYLERTPSVVTISPLPGRSIIMERAIVRDLQARSGTNQLTPAAGARA